MSQSWAIFDDDDITSTQKLVYYCLCNFQGEHVDCFPSHRTIAKQCRIHVSTVKRAIDVLIKRRYLEKVQQKRPDGGNTTCRYRCLK